ncbi:MAG: hypothetical protein Hyperionvirus8_52 [Hyperionvirus sp.]|uniref:Uncharacterized protein n=1 Tax=Hyperionvirus sp. TaxID=2487770 RepID=A0A3G5A8K0_9VIRU|nr:MAG: hypothetical protein Hyperionvirus8_52 [Hyperionvirus sp.]
MSFYNGKLPGEPGMGPGMENIVVPADNLVDASGLPNVEKLLDRILELLQYINTPPMEALEASDPAAFECHVDAKFEDLSMRYYSVFRLVLDKENREENILKLIDTFSFVKKVQQGEMTIDKADETYKESLNEQYIYSKYGGKANFEQQMKKPKPL